MRSHELFVQRKTNAPKFSPGSMTSWRKALMGVTLLASATGIGLAQHHDGDDPFLPLQVSTISSNGDTTPYGLALVPHDFPDDATISPGELLISNFNSATTAVFPRHLSDRIFTRPYDCQSGTGLRWLATHLGRHCRAGAARRLRRQRSSAEAVG